MENNPLFLRFRCLSLLLCLVIPSLITPPPDLGRHHGNIDCQQR